MKKTMLAAPLILMSGLGISATASALDIGCDDLDWTATRLESNPNIAQHCLEVVERNGAPYAKLHARIERQGVTSTIVRYQLPDGSWGASARAFPGDFTASIDGEDVKIVDLPPRQEVNVYVRSEGNFSVPAPAPAPAVAAAPPPPPPPPPPPAPEPEPEPEPVMLPTTAGQTGVMALLGTLLLMLGGAVHLLRTRR